MYRVLRNSRIPLFLPRKSNDIFTMWQHLVLLTIRQYKGKSYRMFIEWLIETHYLRLFLGLSQIPHFTTLQKFVGRISNSLLEEIISSFIVISGTKHIFAGIDSTGFKMTHASQYYTERTAARRKYAKLSIGADVLQQIICSIILIRSIPRIGQDQPQNYLPCTQIFIQFMLLITLLNFDLLQMHAFDVGQRVGVGKTYVVKLLQIV
jgi:hypothetical protein